MEKLEDELQAKDQALKEEKLKLEEKILRSTLPLKDKREIMKAVKLIRSSKISKELERKIANSPLDPTIGEVAIKEQVKDLIKNGDNYQQLLKEYQEKEEKLNNLREKSRQCKDCQTCCDKHEKQIQEQKEKHEKCNHCGKNVKQINQIKEEIQKTQEKLESLKKTQPEAEKEIQKTTKELNKKKEISQKLRYEAFANRVKCPVLNDLKEERKKCSKCQAQAKKKYKFLLQNPLQHVCLVNRDVSNSEIYLLSKEAVC